MTRVLPLSRFEQVAWYIFSNNEEEQICLELSFK